MGSAASMHQGAKASLTDALGSPKKMGDAPSDEQRAWLAAIIAGLPELPELGPGCKDLSAIVSHHLRKQATEISYAKTASAMCMAVVTADTVVGAGVTGVASHFRDYEPATQSSLWHVGLQTTTMMTLLFGIVCIDEGGASLDDKVTSLLSDPRLQDFRAIFAMNQDCTVGDIIANKFGFAAYVDDKLTDPSDVDAEFIDAAQRLLVRAVQEEALVAKNVDKPSHVCALLLAMIIQCHPAAGGKSIMELMQEKLFTPAGVTGAATQAGEHGPYGHMGLQMRPVHPARFQQRHTGCYRDLFMTIGDMALWTKALVNLASGNMVLPIKAETFDKIKVLRGLATLGASQGWSSRFSSLSSATPAYGVVFALNNTSLKEIANGTKLGKPLGHAVALHRSGDGALADVPEENLKWMCKAFDFDTNVKTPRFKTVAAKRDISPLVAAFLADFNSKQPAGQAVHGVGMSVIAHDGVIASGAAGTTGHERPGEILTTKSRFEVAGTVETMVEVAYTALCVEYGDLSFDTTLREALPHLGSALDAQPGVFDDITVRELLSCKAGFAAYPPDVGFEKDEFDLQTDALAQYFRSAKPEKRGEFVKSFFGHITVGHIVTAYMRRKSGNASLQYGDILRRYVLMPAQIDCASDVGCTVYGHEGNQTAITISKPSKVFSPIALLELSPAELGKWLVEYSRTSAPNCLFGLRPHVAAEMQCLRTIHSTSYGGAWTTAINRIPETATVGIVMCNGGYAANFRLAALKFLVGIAKNDWAIPATPDAIPMTPRSITAFARDGLDISAHVEQFLREFNAARSPEASIPAIAITGADLNGVTAYGLAGVANKYKFACSNRKLDPNAPWHVASCAKPMTVFLLFKTLIEPGIMTLDTKVWEALPHMADIIKLSGYAEATLRQCVSHRAGFPYQFPGTSLTGTDAFEPPHREEKLRNLFQHVAPEFAPDAGHCYSNVGYVVIGHAIETYIQRTTGDASAHFFSILKKELFDPLGMTGAMLGPAGNAFAGHSDGVTAGGSNADNGVVFTPAGRMSFPPRELALWLSVGMNMAQGRAVTELGVSGETGKLVIDSYQLAHAGHNGYWHAEVSLRDTKIGGHTFQVNRNEYWEIIPAVTAFVAKLREAGVLM